MSNTYTSEYFRAELCKLRDMWGYKPFWEDSEEGQDKRDQAMKAVAYVYCNVEGKVNDLDVSAFQGILSEYGMRESALIMSGRLTAR